MGDTVMSRVIIQGNALGTGSVTVEGPNTNSTYTQTLAAVGGTLAPLVSGTSATASGTSVDFTDIPAWAKRITVMFAGVSTNGTSAYIVQLGAGSITTSGYLSAASVSGTGTNATSGLIACGSLAAATNQTGLCSIVNIAGNTWVSTSIGGPNTGGAVLSLATGSVSLSGVLDRIRFTTFNGTDTFDAGTINVMWE